MRGTEPRTRGANAVLRLPYLLHARSARSCQQQPTCYAITKQATGDVLPAIGWPSAIPPQQSLTHRAPWRLTSRTSNVQLIGACKQCEMQPLTHNAPDCRT